MLVHLLSINNVVGYFYLIQFLLFLYIAKYGGSVLCSVLQCIKMSLGSCLIDQLKNVFKFLCLVLTLKRWCSFASFYLQEQRKKCKKRKHIGINSLIVYIQVLTKVKKIQSVARQSKKITLFYSKSLLQQNTTEVCTKICIREFVIANLSNCAIFVLCVIL